MPEESTNSQELVVDASLALAWLFEEPQAEPLAAWLRTGRLTLWAPSLWTWEMLNGLVLGLRRARLSAAQGGEALALCQAFPVRLDAAAASTEVYRLATTLGLTAYDALYLELARRRCCGLATLDSKLGRAARRAGTEWVKAPKS